MIFIKLFFVLWVVTSAVFVLVAVFPPYLAVWHMPLLAGGLCAIIVSGVAGLRWAAK